MLLIAVLGLGPGRKHTMLSDSIQTAGHFVAFGVLCLATAWGARPFFPATPAWRAIAALLGLVIAVGAGAFVEVAQKVLPGRDASWSDLAKDTQGALAALSVVGLGELLRRGRPTLASQQPSWLRWPAALLLIGSLAWFLVQGLLPTIDCAWDYWQRSTMRADLMPMEQPWVKRFMWADEGVRVDLVPTPSDWPYPQSMKLADLHFPANGGFPGFGMREVSPDWRNHEWFVFEVRNTSGAELRIGFRIHDVYHDNDYYDRFNTTLHLLPGNQTVRVPLSEVEKGPRRRRMDMGRVEGFKIMSVYPDRELPLLVGGFRLE